MGVGIGAATGVVAAVFLVSSESLGLYCSAFHLFLIVFRYGDVRGEWGIDLKGFI